MSKPIVNTSVKPFSKIKGRPGTSKPPKYYDWAPPYPNASAQKKGLFEADDDITTPLKQIGMNPQYTISLPCVEVNDLPNKRIHQGRGQLFNGQLLNAKPITGMDKIAFDKSMRVGDFGMDVSQKPFAFSSFNWAC